MYKSELRRRSHRVRRGLFEHDADLSFFPPHDAARHAVSVRSQNEGEVVGDSNRGCYVEHRPGIRHIANDATDRAATELNRSGFFKTRLRRDARLFMGVPLVEH
jgi:hypothetical protein